MVGNKVDIPLLTALDKGDRKLLYLGNVPFLGIGR